MRIAAIDQGTTSTRVLVADTDGAAEIRHSVRHRQILPQTGWVEHDPDALIESIKACLAAAGPVDAIGIATREKAASAGTRRRAKRCHP